MKKLLLSLLTILSAATISASEPKVVKLYPDGAPDSNGITAAENCDSYGDLTNVTEPTLTIYLPKKSTATGQAIVICPGGGYYFVSFANEGSRAAKWFASKGIAAIVLKYRVPNGHDSIPLEDAHNAIRYVRRNAESLGVNPHKIGIIGFSAGGHLAATASNLYNSSEERPDFSILTYPVITMRTLTHGGSRNQLLGKTPDENMLARYSMEEHVTRNTPPTFIAHCADDSVVPVMNSLNYAERLVACKVPFAMHIYPKGGHGWGFTEGKGRLSEYRTDFYNSLETWLKNLK